MKPKNRGKAEDSSDRPTARYRVATVAYAAQMLQKFGRDTRRLDAEQMAREIELSPALARRTLNTLCQRGLMRRIDGDAHTYELGLAWLRLADVRRRQFDIRQLALPIMRAMRDSVNETVILSIRAGYKRINIDYMESTQAIRRITQPGLEAPLHVGAAGRALMCMFTREQLDSYCRSADTASRIGGAPLSTATLLKAIEGIRHQGYATAVNEITNDTAAVAAPVMDYTGAVVAALTLSCPRDRFTAVLKEACVVQATQGAAELSRLLGYQRNTSR